MIVGDGGAVYTGQALRMKYRNLVEAGLQGEDGRVPVGSADGAGMESGRASMMRTMRISWMASWLVLVLERI